MPDDDLSKAVAIVSGGLDDTTLAYYLHSKGYVLHLLSFDYGQRHSKELQFARRCAKALGAEYSEIDITSVGCVKRQLERDISDN